MKLTLNYITVYTEQLHDARRFYLEQLMLTESQYSSSKGYSLFATPDANLVLQATTSAFLEGLHVKPKHLVGRMTGISLTTSDIQASYNQLSMRGVLFLSEPKQQHWGGWLAYFQDLDKNILSLVG